MVHAYHRERGLCLCHVNMTEIRLMCRPVMFGGKGAMGMRQPPVSGGPACRRLSYAESPAAAPPACQGLLNSCIAGTGPARQGPTARLRGTFADLADPGRHPGSSGRGVACWQPGHLPILLCCLDRRDTEARNRAGESNGTTHRLCGRHRHPCAAKPFAQAGWKPGLGPALPHR